MSPPAITMGDPLTHLVHSLLYCSVDILRKKGISFAANERTLHESDPESGLDFARPCPQFETVLVLREPVSRVQSHILEVDRAYSK